MQWIYFGFCLKGQEDFFTEIQNNENFQQQPRQFLEFVAQYIKNNNQTDESIVKTLGQIDVILQKLSNINHQYQKIITFVIFCAMWHILVRSPNLFSKDYSVNLGFYITIMEKLINSIPLTIEEKSFLTKEISHIIPEIFYITGKYRFELLSNEETERLISFINYFDLFQLLGNISPLILNCFNGFCQYFGYSLDLAMDSNDLINRLIQGLQTNDLSIFLQFIEVDICNMIENYKTLNIENKPKNERLQFLMSEYINLCFWKYLFTENGERFSYHRRLHKQINGQITEKRRFVSDTLQELNHNLEKDRQSNLFQQNLQIISKRFLEPLPSSDDYADDLTRLQVAQNEWQEAMRAFDLDKMKNIILQLIADRPQDFLLKLLHQNNHIFFTIIYYSEFFNLLQQMDLPTFLLKYLFFLSMIFSTKQKIMSNNQLEDFIYCHSIFIINFENLICPELIHDRLIINQNKLNFAEILLLISCDRQIAAANYEQLLSQVLLLFYLGETSNKYKFLSIQSFFKNNVFIKKYLKYYIKQIEKLVGKFFLYRDLYQFLHNFEKYTLDIFKNTFNSFNLDIETCRKYIHNFRIKLLREHYFNLYHTLEIPINDVMSLFLLDVLNYAIRLLNNKLI